MTAGIMTMNDTFDSYTASLESPASHAFPVIPSDISDLPVASRALSVASDGTVQLTTISGDTVTLTIFAGVPFPIRCARVWATGTTATDIVALY